MVGNGNPVGVSGQVLYGVAVPVERLLHIDVPVHAVQLVEEGLPAIGRRQLFCSFRDHQLPGRVQAFEAGHELAPVQFGKGFYRNEEASVFRQGDEFFVPREPAAGDHAVHVHVVAELLVPRVEDLDDPGRCPEVFRVARELDQGLPHAPVEELVHRFLVCGEERVEFVGKGPDDVEIGGVDQLPLAFLKPCGFSHGLAVGAVPVSAGSWDNLYVPALRALIIVLPQFSRLAAHDAETGGHLFRGKAVRVPVGIEGCGEYLADPVLFLHSGTSAHRRIPSMELWCLACSADAPWRT